MAGLVSCGARCRAGPPRCTARPRRRRASVEPGALKRLGGYCPLGLSTETTVACACVNMYAVPQPCRSHAVRVPASCVPYVPTARGSSHRVPTYGYGSSAARAPEPDAPCVPHAYLGTPALHHGWSFGGAARTAPAAARESSRPRTAPPRPPQQHRRPPSRPATPVAQMDARGMPGVTSVEYWDTLTPTPTPTDNTALQNI